MSSLFTPHETDQAYTAADEQIPTYSEATASPPALLSDAVPPPVNFADQPPTYALLDAAQTSFSIYGTFIHTPAGPAYQLSSPLDHNSSSLRIRRLRAKEAQLLGRLPIAFDKDHTLYEVKDPPLQRNVLHIHGKRRTCLPGELRIMYKHGKWRVLHIPRADGKASEILSCKSIGAPESTRLTRKRGLRDALWKDRLGRVVATERLTLGGDGRSVPMVELSPDLDQTWRELLLTLWATRLWAGFE